MIRFSEAAGILGLLQGKSGTMKKLLLVFATALLIPGMLSAATLGGYFDFAPARMANSPAPFSFSEVSLGMGDYRPLVIRAHPASGELRGSFAPENESFPIVGPASILCPERTGRQEDRVGVRSIVCADRVRFVAG